MTKTLRVIEPFFIAEIGDLFEYDKDSDMYITKHNEEFYKNNDAKIDEVKSSYKSEFRISSSYAEDLVEDGYLEEVHEKDKSSFVNIFDEIDGLLTKYKNDLDTVDKDVANLPACVKVERQTVLTNLITLLEHLKSLKK